MSTSSRRYGVELDDPDVESRLRRIELALEGKQGANFQNEAVDQRRSRLALQRVSGVRLDNSIIGSISVRWNPLDSNINRYEVQISTVESFTQNLSIFKTNEPLYQFSELDPEDTFFVRVRGIGTRQTGGIHDGGDWSAVLNTTTGQASFTNLQAGAASNVVVTTQSSGFSPATIGNNESSVYATTLLDFPTTAEVLLFGFAKFDYFYGLGETITIDVLVDGDSKQQYETRLDTATTAGRNSVPGLGFPQLLGAGVHRLELGVTVGAGTGTEITPVEFTLAIFEQRR